MMRYEFAAHHTKGKRVADIACGTGYGAHHILNHGRAESVVGIDISKDAIGYAKEHYSADNLDFMIGDATSLPLDNEVFDVVVSFETIEHIHYYEMYLREIHRILKPGGTFIVSTPNKKWSGENPYHISEFTLSDFREVLADMYTDVRIYGQDHRGFLKRIRLRLEIIMARVIPEKTKDMLIPDRVRRGSPNRQIGGFVDEGVSNCMSLVGVCVK